MKWHNSLTLFHFYFILQTFFMLLWKSGLLILNCKVYIDYTECFINLFIFFYKEKMEKAEHTPTIHVQLETLKVK